MAAVAVLGLACAAAAQGQARWSLESVPQTFEPNRGQSASPAEFLSRGRNYTLLLGPKGAVMRVGAPAAKRSATVEMSLPGASAHATAEPGDPQGGTSNYFIGNDPKLWRTNIPHYGRVTYHNIYPGVDIVYYGNQERLEYDLILAPGADPKQIRLKFRGARALGIDPRGDLVLAIAGGEIRQRKPVLYEKAGRRARPIDGSYVLLGGGEVGFRVGRHDPAAALTIDPVLLFSSYLGGSGGDAAYRLTLDASSNIYITGTTSSADFPTRNALRPSLTGASAAFVTKISSAGQILYSTYLGGSGSDAGSGIALDSAGNIYVTGQTQSANFPTVGAIQATLRGQANAFVAKINAAGNALVYSTYLGGSGIDYGFGIGVDSAGRAYISGYTGSPDFPTLNAVQATYGGLNDGFVAGINAAGNALVYSTYLGGNGGDYANYLLVDTAGNAYIAGDTTSTNLPTLNAYQAANAGGTDAFISKLSPTGGLVFSTYLGGAGLDAARDIRLDANGNLWVTGETTSTNFPTVTPIQGSNHGGRDIYLAKLSASGSSLLYSTYIGGSGDDRPNGLATDSNGSVYISGTTASADFPTVNPVQASGGGGNDAFLVKVSATGSSILFSTYLGGSNFDAGWYLGVDNQGTAYLTGETQSANFPTASAFQPAFAGGGNDAFIAKIGTCAFSLSPTGQSYGTGAASGNLLVTTTAECSWTAVSNAPWITLTGAQSGTGNGTVPYSIAANSGAPRTGTVSVSGQTFTVTQVGSSSAPVLSSIAPASGTQGTSVPVTLTGANFASGATVTVTNPGVAVGNVVVASATQITATFTIAASAALGAANVTVTTSAGASNAAAFTVTAPVAFTPIRVNAGGPAYTDPLGQTWSADYGSTGGYAWSTTAAVYSTNTPALYQSENHGPAPGGGTPLTYTFSVPNGNYVVNLKFAEIWFTAAGQRIFNVTINGQTVLSNFDIVAQAGAAFTAIDKPFAVAVATGQIAIQLPAVVSNPKISAIEIVAAAPPAPVLSSIAPASGAAGTSVPVTLTGTNLNAGVAVNAGPNIAVSNVTVVSATQIAATFAIAAGAPAGTANVTVTTAGGTSNAVAFTVAGAAIRVNAGGPAYTDPLGQAWSADYGFNSGGGPWSNTAGIYSTNTPTLYQTERWGPNPGTGVLTYTFSVPNGNYVVNLKFAEIYFTTTGQRVFNVTINGQTVLSNFDIVAQAGAAFTAIDKPFPVTVTTGQIAIAFPPVVSNPKISAIEIVPASPPAPALSSISPASGTHGTSVNVTLTGTNLNAGVAVNAGPNIAVSNVVAASATRITATFTIAPAAPAGTAGVTVTTAGGTSSTLPFTIQ